MTEFIVYVQEGDDEASRWFFTCEAEDQDHAEEQALNYDASLRVIAVYARVA